MGRIIWYVAIALGVFVVGMALTGIRPGSVPPGSIRTDRNGVIISEPDVDLVPVEGLRPGLWEIRHTIKIIDMPEASPNELSAARQRAAGGRSNSQCHTGDEQMDILEGATSEFDRCRVNGLSVGDGRIAGEMFCRPSLGETARRAGTVSGRYDPDSFEVALEMKGVLWQSGPAEVRVIIDGRQISDDCGSNYGNNRDPGDLPMIRP